MSQNVLKSLLFAAIIAAASLALPAQGGAARVERKAPATSDVQVRLAEVIAMLEEDDLSEPQRDAARKKLQEIVAQLRKQQTDSDAVQGRGSVRYRAVRVEEEDEDDEDGEDEAGQMGRMKVRRLHPEGMAEVQIAEVGEDGHVRTFRIAGHDDNTHVFEMRGDEAAEPRTAPKAPRAPRAPKAPRDPRAPKAPRASVDPRVEVMEVGGEHDPFVVRRIREESEHETQEAMRSAEHMAREDADRADQHAKVMLERHHAQAEAEVARERAIEAEQRTPNTTNLRKAEKARAPAAEDAEVREMIEQMRAEMREIRELMQMIRERAAKSEGAANSAK